MQHLLLPPKVTQSHGLFNMLWGTLGVQNKLLCKNVTCGLHPRSLGCESCMWGRQTFDEVDRCVHVAIFPYFVMSVSFIIHVVCANVMDCRQHRLCHSMRLGRRCESLVKLCTLLDKHMWMSLYSVFVQIWNNGYGMDNGLDMDNGWWIWKQWGAKLDKLTNYAFDTNLN